MIFGLCAAPKSKYHLDQDQAELYAAGILDRFAIASLGNGGAGSLPAPKLIHGAGKEPAPHPTLIRK